MTTITMENMINMRLKKATNNPFNGDGVFMHVCAIMPHSTFHDIKTEQLEKCDYWDQFIT